MQRHVAAVLCESMSINGTTNVCVWVQVKIYLTYLRNDMFLDPENIFFLFKHSTGT